MQKLSIRLETILSMVPINSIVADVGSDHGKLIISLFERGIISYGYAIENKKGPYKRLESAIKEENCLDHIVPMLSDGISELPKDVDTVVVAGMGGKTIIKILKEHLNRLGNVKTLIIDAHSNVPLLRNELNKIGYNIEDEKIVKEDGIYYEIIKFYRSSNAIYSDDDFEFGPVLRQERSQLFKEKYSDRIKEIDYLLSKHLPDDVAFRLNKEKERIKTIL